MLLAEIFMVPDKLSVLITATAPIVELTWAVALNSPTNEPEVGSESPVIVPP